MDVSTLGIAVDSSQVKEAEKALEKLADTSKRTEESTQKLGDKAVVQATALGKSKREADALKLALGGITDAQQKEIDAVNKSVDAHEAHNKKLQEAHALGERVGSGLKTAFGVAAVAITAMAGAAVAAVVAIQAVVAKIADIQDVAEKTGTSADWLVKFKTSADVAGTSIDQIGVSMNMMQRQLAKGSEESRGAARALHQIGIEIDDFRQLDPGAQFELLAQKLDQVEDSGGKVALVQDAIGRSGAELIPFLKEYAQHIGEQTILTGDAVRQADEFIDAQKRASSQLSQLAGAIGIQFLPYMTAFKNATVDGIKAVFGLGGQVSDLKDNQGIKDFARGAAMFLATFIDGVFSAINQIRALGAALDGIAQVGAQVTVGFLNMFSPGAWAKSAENIKNIVSKTNSEIGRVLSQKPDMADNLRKQLDLMETNAGQAGPKIRKKLDLSGYTSSDQKDGKAGRVDPSIKQAENEYRSLMETITKRIAQGEEELTQGRKLTESEKFHIDVMAKLNSEKSKLTAVQRDSIVALLKESEATDANVEAKRRQIKADQDAYIALEAQQKAADEADRAREVARNKIIQAISDQQQAERDESEVLAVQTEMIGANDAARQAALTAVRERIKLRQEEAKIDSAEANFSPDENAMQKERARLASQQRLQNETVKQANESSKAIFGQADSIANKFFTDIFTDGSNAFKNLAHSLKTTLIQALYELTVKKWVVNIVGSFTGSGGVAGAAADVLGGGSGGIGGLANMGSSISSLSGILGGSMGATLGLGSFGAGLLSGGSALMSGGIGGALSAGAGLIGSGSIAGGIGMIAGALGPIALGIYGLYKIFGQAKGGPKVEGSAGISKLTNFGTQLDSNAADAVKALDDTYKKLTTMLKATSTNIQFGVALGMDPKGTAPNLVQVGASSGANYYNPNVGRDEESLKKELAAGSATVLIDALRSSGIDAEVMAYFDKISAGLQGEAKLAAVEAAAAMVEVWDAMKQLTTGFGSLNAISLDATANIVQFAGGLQNLNAGVQAYQQNFFSESEKQGMALDAMAKQLNAAGSGFTGFTKEILESWDKDFFRKTVEGLDTTTEAGQRQFASLMNVAGAFSQVKGSADQAAHAANEQASREREAAIAMQQSLNSLSSLSSGISRLSSVSLDAVGNIAQFAGGMDRLSAGIQAYQTNFFNAAEQNRMSLESMSRQLNAAGSGWQGFSADLLNSWSKDTFRQTVEGLDLTSEAGQRQFASMMNVASGFATVKNQQEQQAAADQARWEEEQRAAEERARQEEERIRQEQEAAAAIRKTIDAFRGLSGYYSSLQIFAGASDDVVQSIASMAGGLDGLSSQMSGFADNFLTYSERRMAVANKMAEAFGQTGDWYYKHLANANEASKLARVDFKNIFTQIDLTTESGKRLAGQMLALQGEFASVTEAIQEPTYYTVASAFDQLSKSYHTQKDELTSTKDKLEEVTKSFKEFSNSLKLDKNLSQLTPNERMTELEKQYATSKLEMERDNYSVDSVNKTESAARALLEGGREFYASGAGYQALYDRVTKDIDAASGIAGTKISDTERQLKVLDEQVGYLSIIKDTLIDVKTALSNLKLVQQGYLVVEGTPHAMGLARVPYNNYAALLHENEAVLTPPQAQTFRDMPNLVAEIVALKSELIQLRRENRQDAGAIVGATFEAMQQAAQVQGEATIKAAKQRVYQSKQRPVLA